MMTNMMRRTLASPIAALMTLSNAAPAVADFHLRSEVGSARLSTPSLPDRDAAQAPAYSRSPFKVARGFGNDVPLNFAARQIVPASVAIRFGEGVDRTVVVSWRGGSLWNRVLAAAVRPLGLHLVTGTTTVLISR